MKYKHLSYSDRQEMEIRRLQRWCNNRVIFRSCKRFEDYI